MYAKIFSQIYDGTLCTKGPWQALVAFQQLLILADQDGNVDMTAEAISRRTTIPLEIIQVGIEALLEPDDKSRTPDEEGRRIVLLSENRDWGWHIVNYQHYRKIKREEDRREYHQAYYQEKRKKKQQLNTFQQSQPIQPIAEAEAYTVKNKTKAARFAVPSWVDSEAWKGFEAMRIKIRKPLTERAKGMIITELMNLKDQGHDPNAVLEQSERYAWVGVFPIKQQQSGGGAHVQWYASEAGIIAKGKEIKMDPRPGESMMSCKARINTALGAFA